MSEPLTREECKSLLDEIARAVMGKRPTDRLTYQPYAIIPAILVLRAQVEELEAELREAQRDSERLNHLEAEMPITLMKVRESDGDVVYCDHGTGQTLRGAIDSAMAKFRELYT